MQQSKLSEEKKSISVIVPCYNEGKSVSQTLDRINEIFKKSTVDFEVIVVNDGSKDNTAQVLENYSGKIKIATNHPNKGYGASLKKGISISKYDWIAIVDADGTYPIEDFKSLLEFIPAYDMVVGARTKNASIPLLRRPAKLFLTKLARYLTGRKIPDLNSGMRVFHKRIFQRFEPLFPDGFSFTTTITMSCLTNEYSVKFIPIEYYKREGKSSIKPLKDFMGFTQLIIRLALYFKPLNVFLPISFFFFLLSIVLSMKDLVNYCSTNFFTCRIGVFSALVFIFAVQTAFLGLLADLIIKRTKL
ncbi:glycosyltransferase family 2 protein [Candidatus Woesearchaeota archaeon]|nr:glycosyltransferase family 2 protein [Candidatus Woesearchaeota archaeon]